MPYNAVKLAVCFSCRVIVPIAAEIVNIGIKAPQSGSMEGLQGDTFKPSADKLIQYILDVKYLNGFSVKYFSENAVAIVMSG